MVGASFQSSPLVRPPLLCESTQPTRKNIPLLVHNKAPVEFEEITLIALSTLIRIYDTCDTSKNPDHPEQVQKQIQGTERKWRENNKVTQSEG